LAAPFLLLNLAAQTGRPAGSLIACFSADLVSRLNNGRHKLPVQFGFEDWQPFANHSTNRTNTSNESKIVLAHILVNQWGEVERRP